MKIVGQKTLLEVIEKNITKGFPRFIILVGPDGSGKQLICNYIADRLGVDLIMGENKVDSVRDIILRAHSEPIPTLFVFKDIDEMSQNAMNALLKITEEPLETSYFILTTRDKEKILETLISRGIVLNMDSYTSEELKEIISMNSYNLQPSEMELMEQICDNPGDLDLFVNYGIQTFYDYCEQVFENIGEVAGCNAFKIVTPLNIKKDSGWDIRLFFNTLTYIAWTHQKMEYRPEISEFIKLCSEYKNKIQSFKGINRQMIMDDWILKSREVLY